MGEDRRFSLTRIQISSNVPNTAQRSASPGGLLSSLRGQARSCESLDRAEWFAALERDRGELFEPVQSKDWSACKAIPNGTGSVVDQGTTWHYRS